VDDSTIRRTATPWPGSVGAVPSAQLGETKRLDGHGRHIVTAQSVHRDRLGGLSLTVTNTSERGSAAKRAVESSARRRSDI